MKPIRVSFVEDDAELRGTLREFVLSADDLCFVSGYGTAEEALEKLPAESPDVVVMDIRLPGMDGIACVEALKRRLPFVRVLMLTVFEDGDQLFKSIAAGASGYLLKSTEPERLLTSIREVHEGGAPFSSTVARKMVDYFQAVRPLASATENLSPRETETLKLLSEGLMYKEIAASLGVSVPSVRTYLHRIYEKLHVVNRTEAVVKYLGLREGKGKRGF
ncbi:MAG: response regulator transcription factor [bacterium]